MELLLNKISETDSEFRLNAMASHNSRSSVAIKWCIIGHLEEQDDDESVALGNCNLVECGYNSRQKC